MRMTDTEHLTESTGLDDLFAQARRAATPADPALLTRVMADASRIDLDRRSLARTCGAVPVGKGWMAGLLAAIGGWPAAGGLAMATVAGLSIGVVAPDSLGTVAGALWGETVIVSLDAPDDLFGLEG